MLDKSYQWSKITNTGNLARSTFLDKLLRDMKEMEATRRDKPSMVRWSFIPKEFERLVKKSSPLCSPGLVLANETYDTPNASYSTINYHFTAQACERSFFK